MPDLADGIDGIVNGASFGDSALWNARLLTCDLDSFIRTFEVDVAGALRLVQRLAPLLTDHSSIVLFGSAGAEYSDVDTAIYNPSKVALCSLGKHLAKTLTPHTRVNVICPGAIGDDWIRQWNISANEVRRFKAVSGGLERIGKPEELAEVVSFLIGQASSYVNGQVIMVDGGSHV
jgi:3-oxoacyl-[acyl-carrier protein] reductase